MTGGDDSDDSEGECRKVNDPVTSHITPLPSSLVHTKNKNKKTEAVAKESCKVEKKKVVDTLREHSAFNENVCVCV